MEIKITDSEKFFFKYCIWNIPLLILIYCIAVYFKFLSRNIFGVLVVGILFIYQLYLIETLQLKKLMKVILIGMIPTVIITYPITGNLKIVFLLSLLFCSPTYFIYRGIWSVLRNFLKMFKSGDMIMKISVVFVVVFLLLRFFKEISSLFQ